MTVRFVADVSSSQSLDLDGNLALIDRAAEIGCSAVKFQLFTSRKHPAPGSLAEGKAGRGPERWELPIEFIPSLASHCQRAGVQFACTPFDLEAVDLLAPYVEFYKVASYHVLWEEFLVRCAETRKPMVISTGMATMDEIRRAVGVAREAGCRDLILLHCVSSYPAPVHECNLSAIETLRHDCDCPVGWSDHSASPAVIYRAVHRWGAEMVEVHVDLEGRGEEYRIGHCWLPEQLEPVIKWVQAGFQADGYGEKSPVPSELAAREWRVDPSDVDVMRAFLHIRGARRA